ncbi:MAG: transposase family protein [Cyanobacteria bacterium P01_D01_bin.115]
MSRRATPELTQKAIKRAYGAGEGSKKELAARFKVSESTVKRICQGVTPASKNTSVQIVAEAISNGDPVSIGGLDLTQHLKDGIKDLTADMKSTDAKSKEGLAQAALKYMQFYVQINPPTLEDFVDRLLDRPDFEPEKFVRILKERYAAKAS